MKINCGNCRFHKVVADPDPSDSFNMDDCAVVCTITDKKQGIDIWDENHYSEAVSTSHKIIDLGIRPYQVKDVKQPKWCPLLGNKIDWEKFIRIS